MTEQLIADLARIGGLRVISRTSVMHYKNARKPVPAIARELQVDAIIEGSVVHAGDQVRITAKLIRGATGEIIWAQSFERDLRDVLALQREVARAITSKVDVTPDAAGAGAPGERAAGRSGSAPAGAAGPPPRAKATEEGLRKAIQYFDGAIAKDPANALAHAGLAEAYIGLSGFYMHPREAMPKAKRAAETALALDESLADAHAALGFIHLVYDWDGPAAEKELLRALDLNPTLATARLNYAAYLTSQARHDEAVREIRRAVNLDPLSIRTHSFGTLFLLFARRYDEAIELARKGLEFEPESAFTLAFQGAGVRGSRAGSRRPSPICREPRSSTTARRFAPCRRMSWPSPAVTTRRERWFGRWRRRREPDTSARTKSRTVYVSLGDQDTANRWFRKGIEDRADCMAWLGVEPWIDPFRADPRYASLLREIGLTPIGAIAR